MAEQDSILPTEEPGWFLDTDHLYLSVVHLIERGWSERMVRRFLVRPDRWGNVDHWKNWTGKRLYYLGRVEIAEGLPEFQKMFGNSAKRRKLEPARIEEFLGQRRRTQGLAKDTRDAMTADEKRISARVERAANLLFYSTPRGRILALARGIKPCGGEEQP